MKKVLLVFVCGLVACKDKPKPDPAPVAPKDAAVSDASKWNVESHAPIVDAAPPPEGDWEICKATLQKVPAAPPTKRVEMIIGACRPCGDWKPILEWQTLQEEGGPNRKLVEEAMAGCTAWCNPNAKVRFMGALDDARASKTRTPWRELAQQCKEDVSARPDGRFVTAPYFALDRIARWAGAQPDGAKLLEPIVIPLPAVSQTGVGVKLPDSAVTKPDILPVQITISATTMNVGPMPIAKLAANGVLPQGEPYPGTPAESTKAEPNKLRDLAMKLGDRVALFASPQVAATRIRDAAAWSGMGGYLAVTSSMGPVGWQQHGISPVKLTVGKPSQAEIAIVLDDTGANAMAEVKKLGADAAKKPIRIVLEPKATVGGLATLLGALAYFEVTQVNLDTNKPDERRTRSTAEGSAKVDDKSDERRTRSTAEGSAKVDETK
jgi:hypothetical protein